MCPTFALCVYKPQLSQHLTNLLGSSASLVTGCLPYRAVCTSHLLFSNDKAISKSLIILPFLFYKKE